VAGVLTDLPHARARVFVIWEPILPTDFSQPTSGTLARLPDARAQQFWDPAHLVATQLAKDAQPPQPEPQCCERDGHLWDLAAVYAPGARWERVMPPAQIFGGPVVHMLDPIRSALANPLSQTARR
jgi:hypothetical protein